MCDKQPLKDILDEGLAPLYAAIAELARTSREGHQWDLTKDDPIRWYVSKRLGWQAVQTSPAYIFTEHYGAVIMPSEWSLFLLNLKEHFKGKIPLIAEVYEWTLTERVQRLLTYSRVKKEGQ